MTIFEAAIRYLELGFSVIPVDHKKVPLIKWEPYQKQKASKEEIEGWHRKWPNMNIGVVTGSISNLLVVDTDTASAIVRVDDAIPESLLVPCQRTPKGGKHFFFQHQEGYVNRARVSEGVDVRTTGGYVVVAPSVNGTGRGWQWVEGLSLLEVQAPSLPNAIEVIIKAFDFKKGGSGGKDVDKSVDSDQKTSTSVYMFEEGRRDEDLFHTANCLTKGGARKEEISQILRTIMLSWGEHDDKWVQTKVDSALKRAERKERNLAEEVKDWVCLQSGYFLSTECQQCLQVSTREERKNLSIILKRLCDQRVIERFGERSGSFRKIENDIELIDWENADDSILPLQLPFEIEHLVSIMPKNILVIAGIPNAGKTAFLLNFARMNMDKWPVLYFSSEMEGAELKGRLKKFEGPLKQWRKVGFYKKEEDFANALNPDGVNIIDFLEITDKFYLIAERLREYHKRLNKGILFVGIQKDPQKEYGRGGGLGLEKPRLYLTMDRGKLKIVKGKTWASEQNPEGMQIEFKIVQGAKFMAQGDWRSPEKKECHENKRFGDDG
jgi:hypothetical protein